MFLSKRKQKALDDIINDDSKIVIYSTKQLLEVFARHISLNTSKLDANDILQNGSEANRINSLVKKFNEIANEALLDTIVVVGYKREDKKKWKIWNWF